MKVNRCFYEEKLFLISFAIFNLFQVLYISFFSVYFHNSMNLIVLLCIGLLIMKELIHGRFSRKDIVFLLVVLFLFITVLIVRGFITASFFIYVFSSRNVNFEKILKCFIVTVGISLVIVVLSAKFGLILNYSKISNGTTKHYLGFVYSLYGPAILFNLSAAYLYLEAKFKNLNVFKCLAIFIINLIFYKLTNANLSFMFSVILILVIYIYNRKKSILKNKFAIYFMEYSYLWCLLISFAFAFSYKSNINWMFNLNNFLENRLSLQTFSLKLFGLSWFGVPVIWQGNALDMNGVLPIGNYLVVDNFYINIAQLYGIIFLSVIIMFLSINMHSLKKSNNLLMMFIFSLFAIHGLIDNLILASYFNVFLMTIFNKKLT